MTEPVQPAASADLAQVWETLYDHGNGKYQGAESKAQRDKAFRILEALAQAVQPVQPVAADALRLALAYIRWQSYGECRTAGHDGPPPLASEVDEALVSALNATPMQPLPMESSHE